VIGQILVHIAKLRPNSKANNGLNCDYPVFCSYLIGIVRSLFMRSETHQRCLNLTDAACPLPEYSNHWAVGLYLIDTSRSPPDYSNHLKVCYYQRMDFWRHLMEYLLHLMRKFHHNPLVCIQLFRETPSMFHHYDPTSSPHVAA
jgi:hypothetical protein